MKKFLLPAVALAANFITAHAADHWPQWRGPGGGGGMTSEKPTKPVQFVIISLDRKTGKPL